MIARLVLPRLMFGAGALGGLAEELAGLGVRRPFLISDRGLERAGLVEKAKRLLSGATVYADVSENPTLAGADAAVAAYRAGGCDGVVAIGGGSVLDTSKFVAALAGGGLADAAELHGRPERIVSVVPLVVIPTTVGTGSESSPVAAMHADPGAPAVGTRSPRLIPSLAICDPELARSLPRRLVAATGIDALSHCIEGFFAEPANPAIDALALDGIARVHAAIVPAVQSGNDAALGSLMAAAFAGGAAIQKGLGPAHAIAVVCGDQDLHHGMLISAALPHVVALVAPAAPAKADRIAAAFGLHDAADIPDTLRRLSRALDLPASYGEMGYRAQSVDRLVERMVASPFNRTSPYVPTAEQYRAVLTTLLH